MSDRITIPTSEDSSPVASPRTDPKPPRRWLVWVVLPIGLVALGAALLIRLDSPASSPLDSAIPEPFQPPTTIPFEVPDGRMELSEIPGLGEVAARFDADGVRYLLTNGEFGESVLWERQGDAWLVADTWLGPMHDAVSYRGQIFVVGGPSFDVGDRSDRGTVLVGQADGLVPVGLPLDPGEVPYRLDVGGDDLFLFTNLSFLGDVGNVTGDSQFNLWVTHDGATWSQVISHPQVRPIDVLSTPQGLLVFGGLVQTPAVWRLTSSDRLDRLEFDIPEGSLGTRLVSAAPLPTGEVVALAVKAGRGAAWIFEETSLASVVDLPSGSWSDLLVVPGGVVAVPVAGQQLVVTRDGRNWEVTGIDVEVTDGLFSTSGGYVGTDGLEVFGSLTGGAGSQPGFGTPARPALASAEPYPFELGVSPWTHVEDLPSFYWPVYLSEEFEMLAFSHSVGERLDPFLVRREGETGWTVPIGLPDDSVFASIIEAKWGWIFVDESGVRSSLDGMEWQTISDSGYQSPLMATDGERVLVVDRFFERQELLIVTESGVEQVAIPAFRPTTLGFVDGLGFVAVNDQSGLKVDLIDGPGISPLLHGVGDQAAVVDGRLVILDFGSNILGGTDVVDAETGQPVTGLFEFRPSMGDLEPLAIPEGPIRGLFSPDGTYALLLTGQSFWLSVDLVSWHKIETGIGGGMPSNSISGIMIRGDTLVVVALDEHQNHTVLQRPLSSFETR